MKQVFVEHNFTGETQSIDSYDPNKTLLGSYMTQNSGSSSTDNWVGPKPLQLLRVIDETIATVLSFMNVIKVSQNKYWIILPDGISSSTTPRYLILWEFDSSTWTSKMLGSIYFPASNMLIRSVYMMRDTYSTGTVSVSGKTVTGSGTSFVSDKFAAGSRIGFGSTDPEQITVWYEIESIDGEDELTLLEPISSLSNVPYVVDELRIYMTLSGTAANAGFYVIKGVHRGCFSSNLSISAATTDDNVRGVYFLADASSTTNTTGFGLAVMEREDANTQYVYVGNQNSTSSISFYKYNIRATLSGLSAGKSTSAFVEKTGIRTGFTATVQGVGYLNTCTPNHGPVKGKPSLMFFQASTSSQRFFYVPLESLVPGSTNFISGCDLDQVPGGNFVAYQTSASGTMSSLFYSSTIDRLIVAIPGNRIYIAKYSLNNDPADACLGIYSRKLDYLYSPNPETPSFDFAENAAQILFEIDGLLFILRQSFNLYITPLIADYRYAEKFNQYVITPKIKTPRAVSLKNVYVNHVTSLGKIEQFGVTPQTYRVWIRTQGIDDNSGTWTLLNEPWNLDKISPTDAVQLRFDFRVLSTDLVTARIHSCGILYEKASTHSNFQLSLENSTQGKYAWRIANSFNGDIPDLKVMLYDATTGNLILEDFTDDSRGTFERSNDNGVTWDSYNNDDKSNENSFIRYTPYSLPQVSKLEPILIGI